MSLYKKLIESNKKTASVVLLIYNDEYILYPMGRSPTRKWVGLQKLDHCCSGKISDLNSANFLQEVYNQLDISMNYDLKGIEPSLGKDEASDFFNKAKNNKFKGFKYLSIDLDFRNPEQIIINIYKRNSANEWGAYEEDECILNENCSEKEFLSKLSSQVALAHSEVIKR